MKISLALKFALIVSLSIAAAVGVVVVILARWTGREVLLSAENTNWSLNRAGALAAQEAFDSARRSAVWFFAAADTSALNAGRFRARREAFFAAYPGIAALAFAGSDGGSAGLFINPRFAASGSGGQGGLTERIIASCLEEREQELREAASGMTQVCDSPVSGLLVLFMPVNDREIQVFRGAAAVFFPAALTGIAPRADAADGSLSFIVNKQGVVIAAEDPVLVGTNAGAPELFQKVMDGKAAALQQIYTNEAGVEFSGAFRRMDNFNALFVTHIASAAVYSEMSRAVFFIIMTGLCILAAAIAAAVIYARTITVPLTALSGAAREMEQGSYAMPLSPAKSRDETGALTNLFIEMRNAVQNFEKFTDPRIVSLARLGKLRREGANKDAVILFTFIRDFEKVTALMRPEEIVNYINAFLSRMIPCITQTGGVIDKYLTQNGLIVMALWGTISQEGGIQHDIIRAVRSTLMMRTELRKWNTRRNVFTGSGGADAGGDFLSATVKMGCALHAGPVVAGQVGSDERMSYTVLGDAVNTTARIEEPNNTYDTDILVTESVVNLAGGLLVTQEMPPVHAKGKSEPLRVFALVNMRDNGGPQTLEEVREQWTT
ncbi:MAG: adenylate/guanylate cyclase domain-containing protein [Spirochaetaceae bacterium]|nr:adenylate/guanylate cyclase domain-containing protein [Spirochaetaceae bacterium]